MRNYEIMFIVRPDIEESVVKNTVKSLERVLTDRKAKITLSPNTSTSDMSFVIKGEVVLPTLSVKGQSVFEN